jgi:hypothetical protein
MKQNDSHLMLKEVLKESGKAAVISFAATFGSFAGLVAVGAVVSKYQSMKEARQTKQIQSGN